MPKTISPIIAFILVTTLTTLNLGAGGFMYSLTGSTNLTSSLLLSIFYPIKIKKKQKKKSKLQEDIHEESLEYCLIWW